MKSKQQSNKEHYARNKEKVYASTVEVRKRNRAYVEAYRAAHPCVKCGEDDTACLDFHHVDPETKRLKVVALANRGLSI
jgi:hypothetical protein